eukprot:m.98706 g.98706  ORF g.98706 m.98706 type:complete len:61 (-) comp27090_c0_seq1:212-394(-)
MHQMQCIWMVTTAAWLFRYINGSILLHSCFGHLVTLRSFGGQKHTHINMLNFYNASTHQE